MITQLPCFNNSIRHERIDVLLKRVYGMLSAPGEREMRVGGEDRHITPPGFLAWGLVSTRNTRIGARAVICYGTGSKAAVISQVGPVQPLARSSSGKTSRSRRRQLQVQSLPSSRLGRAITPLERTGLGGTMPPRLPFESVNSTCWSNGRACATPSAKPQMTCHGRLVCDWLWIVQTR
jgi:hypothetical protein